MADDVMQLDVWAGDWGLPSVDPECLAALTYCKFSGVPVRVMKTNKPYKSPSGSLPVLKYGDKSEAKLSDIFIFLKNKNFGTDLNLSPKDNADVKAFTSMIEERFLPAFLHTWWVDDKTYGDVTRPWFAKAVPFPYNFFVPGSKQKSASLYVYYSIRDRIATEEEAIGKMYRDAKECLNLLSYKLGDKNYFFGSQPSSLDAVVFGFLGPLLKAPLPSNQLTNHLKGCENLHLLCTRILTRYFPPTKEELEKIRKEEEEKKKQQSDDLEFPNKRRDMILAAIFIVLSTFAFSVWSGILRFEIVDDDDDTLQYTGSQMDMEDYGDDYADGGDDGES